MISKNSVLFLFLLVALSACTQEEKMPFDFENPLEIVKLPQSLHEISGITFFRKNELACVQDEKGVIYLYDIKKDKLRKKILFARDRDYEAITNVNDTLFVLCSNGELSEIFFVGDSSYSVTYKTFLSKKNNSEGLCYDRNANRLLVACKGLPEKGTADQRCKAIYEFDLQKKELVLNPVFIIDPDSVRLKLEKSQSSTTLGGILNFGSSTENFLFEPSEVTVDPLTQDVYILSSVGKTIVALTHEGFLKFACHLDPKVYKQPEGLAFSGDGTMFISDEGKGGRANLIRIKRN